MRRLMLWALMAIVIAVSATPLAAQLQWPESRWSGRSPVVYAAFRLPAQQIVCESWQFRRADCPADTRGGVRLLQQTGGVCSEGQTWGHTPRSIWVTNGCRAIFAVIGGAGPGFAPPPQGRLIVCESWRFQPQRCAAEVRHRPRIEVIAGTCTRRTWGWDRGGIWVRGGCRARFLLS